MFETIITFAVGAVSISGIITYLSKSFFEKWMDNKKEDYQAELNKKLEEFRIDKEQISEQNKVKFSRLHEERLIVIKELYIHIVGINAVSDIYIKKAIEFSKVSVTNTESKFYEEQEFALTALRDYLVYSERNMIYFEEEFAEELQTFADIVHSMMDIVSLNIENKLEFGPEDDVVIDNFRRVVPLIKKGLEKRFREILGS